MLRLSRIWSFRHHGVCMASVSCWHSSGRERSKFQLERHNLPQKLFIRILFLLRFFFIFFLFIVHCSSRTVLGACWNSSVHSFEQEETLEAGEEEEDAITIFTFVNTCKLKHWNVTKIDARQSGGKSSSSSFIHNLGLELSQHSTRMH